jgi:hypothetical protein
VAPDALPVSIADVEAAEARIHGHLAPTPVTGSPSLDAITGTDVTVKLENLQRTGSFKEHCTRPSDGSVVVQRTITELKSGMTSTLEITGRCVSMVAFAVMSVFCDSSK